MVIIIPESRIVRSGFEYRIRHCFFTPSVLSMLGIMMAAHWLPLHKWAPDSKTSPPGEDE